jgi:hypothetical protein
MNRISVLVSALVVAVSSVAQEPAQSQVGTEAPRIRRFGVQELGVGVSDGVAKWAIFRLPEVQKELGITEQQKARLKNVDDEASKLIVRAREEHQQRFKELGNPPPDDPAVKTLSQENSAFAREISLRGEALRDKVFTRKQLARLDEIYFQANGPRAFLLLEVRNRLNLQPEQTELIAEIVFQQNQELRAAAAVPADLLPDQSKIDTRKQSDELYKSLLQTEKFSEGLKNARKASLEIRSTAMRSIAKVLTKGQRDRYQRLVGEPFEFGKVWAAREEERKAQGKAAK